MLTGTNTVAIRQQLPGIAQPANNYPQRQHDSVKVELHAGVAIVKGKMDIQKINNDKTDRYHLRYIRIYALRNKHWQMISHNTTHEWHEGVR